MRYLIYILIATFPLSTLAQIQLDRQVIGSTGGEGGNSNLEVAYTVGEAVVQTFSTSTLVLTQGFHQPDGILVGMATPEGPRWDISTFPNPTEGPFTLQLGGDYAGKILLQIVTLEGRTVYQTNVVKPQGNMQVQLDLSRWAAGTYYLSVQAQGQASASMAIQKIN